MIRELSVLIVTATILALSLGGSTKPPEEEAKLAEPSDETTQLALSLPPAKHSLDVPIYVLEAGKPVSELPAERYRLPIAAGTRADPLLGRDKAGRLYLAFQDFGKRRYPLLLSSSDGGQNWVISIMRLNPKPVKFAPIFAFGALWDGTLVVAYHTTTHGETPFVTHSIDGGRTWPEAVALDISPYDICGGFGAIRQAPDGTVLLPCRLIMEYFSRRSHEDKERDPKIPPALSQRIDGRGGWDGHLFVSFDGGKTWPEKRMITSRNGETSIFIHPDGKNLTAIIRSSPGRIGSYWNHQEQKWVNPFGIDISIDPEKLWKRLYLVDSLDMGNSWRNLRKIHTIGYKDGFGDVPGNMVRIPDGRLVLFYAHRYIPKEGVWALVSDDRGNTWGSRHFVVRYGEKEDEVGSYSSSVVMDDGTIVTVNANFQQQAQVIRWRPLPAGKQGNPK